MQIIVHNTKSSYITPYQGILVGFTIAEPALPVDKPVVPTHNFTTLVRYPHLMYYIVHLLLPKGYRNLALHNYCNAYPNSRVS